MAGMPWLFYLNVTVKVVYVRRIKEKASWPVLTGKNINSDQFKFLGNCPPTPPLS